MFEQLHQRGTLHLASMSLPSARRLADVATALRWDIFALDEFMPGKLTGPRTFYGGSDRAGEFAERFELCLIEPPLDLLARVPFDLLCRRVEFAAMGALSGFKGPLFVKPADPVARIFDPGVYRTVSDIRPRGELNSNTLVLVSEPVEWSSEFRCFICEGKIEAWSPYLSFGRPTWKPGCAGAIPANLGAFCDRLIGRMGEALPPAFVVDVGVLNDGRWAVVEFNPAWCSGILGANVEAVFKVIRRAARRKRSAPAEDRRWERVGVSM